MIKCLNCNFTLLCLSCLPETFVKTKLTNSTLLMLLLLLLVLKLLLLLLLLLLVLLLVSAKNVQEIVQVTEKITGNV